jgi:hypothetical protein
MNPKTVIDKEIESLKSETDPMCFDRRLDGLVTKIKKAKLYDKYEPKLMQLLDALDGLIGRQQADLPVHSVVVKLDDYRAKAEPDIEKLMELNEGLLVMWEADLASGHDRAGSFRLCLPVLDVA